MGTQDIQGYTGYTVSLGYSWLYRIYRGIQGYTCYAGIITYCTNILAGLYGDYYELLAR